MGGGSFETSPYQPYQLYDVRLKGFGLWFWILHYFLHFLTKRLWNASLEPSEFCIFKIALGIQVYKKSLPWAHLGLKPVDMTYIGLFGSLQGCKARDVKLRAEGISGPGLFEPSVCWSLKLGVKELNMSCHNVETMLITFQYFTHW